MFFRNFWVTLTRFRLTSALNILSLAVAFAAFIIIMMQVSYDRSFDKFHPKSDRTFRVEVSDGTQYNALVGRKWADLIKTHLPQIEATGLRMAYSPIGNYLKIGEGASARGFRQDVHLIHPDFVNVFDFDMAEGNREALQEPNKILLPQSLARRYFGNEPALGRPVIFIKDKDTVMTVGGVYRDFPRNTLVQNVIYYGVNPNVWGAFDGWQFNYELFVTIPAGVNRTDVEAQLVSLIHSASDVPDWLRETKSVRLYPVGDLFYANDVAYDGNPKGNAAKTYVLLGIAMLILLVAAVNFINFATSLIPLRIKNINTRKILGDSVTRLRAAMVGEAVGISLLAYLLGLFLVYTVDRTGVRGLFTADIALSANTGIALFSLAIALTVGALAGLYPAFYSTGFPPVMVLKGSFGLSPKGRFLRTSLVCFQYVVSMGLIIGALFMHLQTKYLRNQETGFKSDDVAVIYLNDEIALTNRSLLTNKLKENPQVSGVAFSQFLFGTGDAQSNALNLAGKEVKIGYFPITPEFLDVFDIKPHRGSEFQ